MSYLKSKHTVRISDRFNKKSTGDFFTVMFDFRWDIIPQLL